MSMSIPTSTGAFLVATTDAFPVATTDAFPVVWAQADRTKTKKPWPKQTSICAIIPKELIEHIMPFLNLKDGARFISTCKELNKRSFAIVLISSNLNIAPTPGSLIKIARDLLDKTFLAKDIEALFTAYRTATESAIQLRPV